MVGFLEIEELDGMTAKRENLVVDKKEKKEKDILHVGQLNQNVLNLKERKKDQNGLVGKKELNNKYE
jgi:hypothetical protein